jgi:cytochrome b pre-mRNA-processing protein 3
MKLPLFHSNRRQDTIAALYGAIVAQARSPAFYAAYGVPDTVNGRLEMIILHLFLFIRRLRSEPENMRGAGQEVFDLFCRDMDANLRELGVGDLAVPRQMRQIGEAFYGRATAYDAALSAADEGALNTALMRNIFAGLSQHSADAARLAAYMKETIRHLDRQHAAAYAQGRISFSEPAPAAAASFAHSLPA